jgi:hypothetical protein
MPADYDRPGSEQRALGSDQSLRLTERHLRIRNDAPDQVWEGGTLGRDLTVTDWIMRGTG